MKIIYYSIVYINEDFMNKKISYNNFLFIQYLLNIIDFTLIS